MTEQNENQTMIVAQRGGMALTRAEVDPMAVLETIKKAKEAGFNVLTPPSFSSALPPDHVINIRKIETGGANDFYDTGGGKFAPSGRLLSRIATAGGIRWRVDLIRRLDDRRDPHYCEFEAVGVVPDPATGEPRAYKGSYALDLRKGSARYEEALAAARKSKYCKDEADALAQAERSMNAKRKFIVQLAETGARLRVCRDAFGLRSDYTSEQTKMDFVVVALDYQPGISSDPETRKMLAAEAMKLRQSMYYGIGEVAQAPPKIHEGHAAPALPAPDEYKPGEEPPDLSEMEKMTADDIPF